jgi:hypothetical protein
MTYRQIFADRKNQKPFFKMGFPFADQGQIATGKYGFDSGRPNMHIILRYRGLRGAGLRNLSKSLRSPLGVDFAGGIYLSKEFPISAHIIDSWLLQRW